MSDRPSIEEVRCTTYKARDAWWTVLLVDPMAARLVQWVAPYRWITPNKLTGVALLLGLGAAACFATAAPGWLVLGAALFHLSFVVDCMDGKVARLNGTGSFFGIWLDFVVDEIRIIVCTLALMGAAFAATDDPLYLYAATGILSAHLIRYMSAWHMGKVRAAMRKRQRAIARLTESATAPAPAETTMETTGEDDESPERQQIGPRGRIRQWLLDHRIRTHLVSGIEFQMAAFIIGPLTGAIVLVPAVTGVAMLAYEALLAYRLLRQVQSFERTHPLPPTPQNDATIPSPRAGGVRLSAPAV